MEQIRIKTTNSVPYRTQCINERLPGEHAKVDLLAGVLYVVLHLKLYWEREVKAPGTCEIIVFVALNVGK